MAENPGSIIKKISGLKIGEIRRGYIADLTIISDENWILDLANIKSKSKNYVMNDKNDFLKGKPIITIFEGKLINNE